MDLIQGFLRANLMYWQELWLTLFIGFLLSGVFYKFIPTNIVERHLGEKGLKPILIAATVGTLLPVCCVGSLPIALTLRRKGAALGAVLAFLVATPATSISALIVCWKLLGTGFTIVIFFAIIIMALVMGIIINKMHFVVPPGAVETEEPCCQSQKNNGKSPDSTVSQKIKEVFSYAFITLPKEIGLEIIIGVALASFITVFEPLRYLIREYLTGLTGYFFILIIGLVTYVCSTASIPMADAFLHSGMSYGQGLCYLLVGPITSYGTILVIKKDFGSRVLVVYLSVICIMSLSYGLIYDAIINYVR
jgi:hypothetical protein